MLNSKMKEEERVQVCPNCGSTNVRPDLSKEMIAWGGSTRMACRDCDHSGLVFPEIPESQVKEYAKTRKVKSKETKEVYKEESASKGVSPKGSGKWGYYLLATGLLLFVPIALTGEWIIAISASAFPLILGTTLVLKKHMSK